MSSTEIVDNVGAFIERASEMRAELAKRQFTHDMEANCVDLGMSSPIEHLFWVAVNLFCAAHYEAINPDPGLPQEGVQHRRQIGVYVHPQHKVGPYRVDFMIERVWYRCDHGSPIVVELDGHAFHDKDKEQRAREKARDRFLVAKGYRVIHFTGSEVVADPLRVAYEALSLIGVTPPVPYDKSDPFWAGSY